MGAALAGALLDAGQRVTVWNRTTARAQPLALRGAHVAASAEEAALAAPLTVVCVARYEHARQALDGVAPGALDGRSLVNLTWGTAVDAQEMAECVARMGGGYLDGGIPVTPALIGGPETRLVYSGPVDLWRRHEALLRTLGGASCHVGEGIGDANVLSLAIPGVFYTLAYSAFLEAAAFATAQGLPAPALRTLVQTSIRVLEEQAERALEAASNDNYTADQVSLDIQLDSIVMALEDMRRVHQRATLTKAAVDLCERGIAAGLSNRSPAALVRLLRDGG
jgi:3-hydroxyisobutyrate dehydrogenase-like beta-hydroxyacid dehydrogenase